ncbi:50S ribosomal protein L9 [Candidatus Marinimicrobia bacterium]|jgi:large subunit ribosomal protein L9|nr:50S ribosomal protein L9 [Candidatus Neomarinimicrobiota bacterium]MDA7685883.1 50S ribosomal protein L9 [Candidatus Neomarinimicrobiota bacterium]MDA9841180.1 50S ribosomal protein L9 [Candidatus Neomarinimicrobiota bacterium]MDB3887496.1 50S ribosomal protein L9 [Candidatus Neomarinimicrobiota bacterium]MDC0521167.1 50S ribosomal protein L9 [Candidatus Neomarinimicrobiota bacterium]|tara:strand:+ start:105 stop:551 length:447 start_codon:yes stop_codon:yes gene_type:complete
MKLILIQDVDNVGNEGDVVDVKPGFGRNFLIPQKLAVTFSKSQLKQVEEKRSNEDRKIDRQKDVLLDLLSKVADLNITVKMKSEDGEKLFGSITKLDIEKLLVENDIVFDKKYIDLSAPIKTLGEHEINVKFSNDISGSFKLTIEKED